MNGKLWLSDGPLVLLNTLFLYWKVTTVRGVVSRHNQERWPHRLLFCLLPKRKKEVNGNHIFQNYGLRMVFQFNDIVDYPDCKG
jgi:hypothetical protein